MTMLLPCARPRTSLLSVLSAALLLAGGGCKPSSSPPNAAQPTPPTNDSTLRQPTAADFQAFFQSLFPPTVKVSEVKMDPPVRLPDASPASNAWLLTVKVTFTPVEDLFSLPAPEDTQPIDNAVAELNSLVNWRNAYVQSPYAKACGAFEVKVPASPMPQLVVLTQWKDQPFPPLYGRVAAEWQVDHWQFTNMSLTLPKAGETRGFFQGATMVKGSPEAEKALGEVRDAIAQARKEIESIRSRYAEQVAQGTRPGTAYQGRVTFREEVRPCELRFLDPPPGGDARFAAFEVRLPGESACLFTYNAKVATELPIAVPGAIPATANPSAVTGYGNPNPVTASNVSARLVRSSGKMDERTLPGQIFRGSQMGGPGDLLLLAGRMEGVISYYLPPSVHLAVQQTNPSPQ